MSEADAGPRFGTIVPRRRLANGANRPIPYRMASGYFPFSSRGARGAEMKTWFKRIVIGLVVLVLVAVVGLAIFLLTFDPNAYKYKLEELVQERYHRTLAIDGELELSLFPRIGLSVQGVSLSEVDSPDTFASIGSMRLAVAVWPLLSSNLVVDHVAINGFKARVVRDKNGHLNFENLVGGGAANTLEPAGPATAAVGAMAGAAQALATAGAAAPATTANPDAGAHLRAGRVRSPG